MKLNGKHARYFLFAGYTYIIFFSIWSYGRSFGPDGRAGFFLDYGVYIKDLLFIMIALIHAILFGRYKSLGKIWSITIFTIFCFYIYIRIR